MNDKMQEEAGVRSPQKSVWRSIRVAAISGELAESLDPDRLTAADSTTKSII